MGIADPAGLELLERLGGSRATVHRAMQHGSGRVVVVKHAPWDRADVVAGLGREAAVLQRVQHPSLPRLLDVVEDETGRSLVLRLAAGGSLEQRLATTGPLEPGEAAGLGASLASALAALHRAGVTHRDVHPGNVLFDAELQPVLADLDHALDPQSGPLPVDGEVVGHPDHLDPRLLEGTPPGPASDLHSLATTIRAALGGGTPSTIPPELRAAIDACLDGSIGDAPAAAASFEAARIAAATWVPTCAAPQLAGMPAPIGTPSPGPAPAGVRPPARAHALRGGGAAVRSVGTRRFGPAPVRTPRRLPEPARRAGWLAIAAAVLAVPLVVVGWTVARGGQGPQPSGFVPAAGPPAAVAPLPPCDPAEAAAVDAVLADVDGSGCSVPVRYESGVLELPTGAFRVGEDGDVLVMGDWDGDGSWTPGLYRPANGMLFLFESTPGDRLLESLPAEQLRPGGAPVVVDPDGDGVHEVHLAAGTAA